MDRSLAQVLLKKHYLSDWTQFSPDSVPTPMTRVSTTVSSVMVGPSMAIPCAMLCFTSSWLWELSANWARTVAFDKSISSRKKKSASLQHKHHLWGKITLTASGFTYAILAIVIFYKYSFKGTLMMVTIVTETCRWLLMHDKAYFMSVHLLVYYILCKCEYSLMQGYGTYKHHHLYQYVCDTWPHSVWHAIVN